jgi:3-oxoacyl-[acyl-carrier-protein] synthase II
MDAPTRVVVTGIGAVTSIGIGRDAFWKSLLDGRSGISPVESFDTRRYQVHLGGEVKAFDPARFVTCQPPGSMGRASQLAIAASRLALGDAGVDPAGVDPARVGVALGTTSGEPEWIERFDDRELAGERDKIGCEFLNGYPCHVLAAHVGSELGFRGVNLVIPTACAAGNYAVAYALDTIRMGDADVMLAGGADAFSRITYTGFARLGAIAPERVQPFDRNRKGMIPGEGSAVLVIERLDRALARGARIYAELAGYGLSCDASHMTAPQGDGAVRAMRAAMHDAGLSPDEISYISAHGTGTPANDRVETIAVKQAFGAAARRVPMSSVKSMLGHTMGAASAIEAAACVLAVAEDRIPPTINLEARDPECDLDYVPARARAIPVETAMNNAYAFGGNNASVIFRKLRAERQGGVNGKQAGVVITGTGIVSALGDRSPTLHAALLEGRTACGAGTLRREQAAGRGVAEVRDFQPRAYLGPGNLRPLDRTGQLAAAAVELALADAGWTLEERERREVGLVLGTTFCSVRTIGEFDRRAMKDGPEYASPIDFSNTVLNAAAGQVAIWHHLRGVNSTVSSGAASGLHAIGYAAQMIRTGRAAALVAGGAEEVCFESFLGFLRAGLLTARGEAAAPRPCDVSRDGTVLGEGAAFLVLESEEDARMRGARILGRVEGCGYGYDSRQLAATKEGPHALTAAIVRALGSGGPAGIGAVMSSASGHRVLDAREAAAIREALGVSASETPVSTIKGHLGETLGAGGALQTIVMLEALRTRQLPPIAGLEQPDSDMEIDLVTGGARAIAPGRALVTALSREGNACALVIAAAL